MYLEISVDCSNFFILLFDQSQVNLVEDIDIIFEGVAIRELLTLPHL